MFIGPPLKFHGERGILSPPADELFITSKDQAVQSIPTAVPTRLAMGPVVRCCPIESRSRLADC
jgi:hypothetical protein